MDCDALDQEFTWTSELLEGFRIGDPTALREVYCANVYSVTFSVTGALKRYAVVGFPWVLSDLVQEVFARAFGPEARARTDATRPYGSYLRAIARHLVIDQLRHYSKVALVDNDRLVTLVEERAFSACGSVSSQRDTALLKAVDEYLHSLPYDLERVYRALYVEGLSQRETAAKLGVGRQTVRSKAAQLLEGLRRSLSSPSRSVRQQSLPAETCSSSAPQIHLRTIAT
jgi:RNA polymerase sigma factor (sigma-70 family)